jgi:hypothetical protein
MTRTTEERQQLPFWNRQLSHKGKLEKPKAKDTETDWTEDGAASMLLEYFIKLTRHCTIEEKESVSHKTIEALQEHVAAEREEYDEE